MREYAIIACLSALLMGASGAIIIIIIGKRLGLLDKPNYRSSHQITTPKGGGIGILASFLLFSIMLSFSKSFWIPVTVLSLISFIGDKFEITPKFRLGIQFASSFILLSGFFLIEQIHFADYFLVTFFSVFIVGTANYYNFMDGINGIAAITGAIAFGFLSYFAFLTNSDSAIIMLSICISFSCIGFLPFNMPDAKIFMGDVGSVLLGFVFASIVVFLSQSFLDFICLIAFLFPFYTDELTTLAVRIKDGDKLTHPHRKHLYQLLVNELKLSHWKISVAYGIIQLFVGISVLILRPLGIVVVLFVLTIYFIGFAFVSYLVRRKVRFIENKYKDINICQA